MQDLGGIPSFVPGGVANFDHFPRDCELRRLGAFLLHDAGTRSTGGGGWRTRQSRRAYGVCDVDIDEDTVEVAVLDVMHAAEPTCL